MKTNKHGEIVLDQRDLFDAVMRGQDLSLYHNALVDNTVDLSSVSNIIDNLPQFVCYDPKVEQMSTQQFDQDQQSQWFMPTQYRNLDIAKHVIDLCGTQQELQRVAQELLLYQEKNLFDLLRYLKYLVDVMRDNGLIWGVGRGSSVASYVLYLLGVHKINSIYYDLDPREFLR